MFQLMPLHWGQVTTAVTVSGGIAGGRINKDVAGRGKVLTTSATGGITSKSARGRSSSVQGSGSSGGIKGKGRNG